MSNDVIQMKFNRVVKLSAAWCGPCKQYAPVFDSVVAEFEDEWNVSRLDIDEPAGKELATNMGIRSVPATIFITPSNEPEIVMGALPESELIKKFNNHRKIN